MVLTKLFNIFSITASMGSGLLTTPTRTPTRDVTNINLSFNELVGTTIATKFETLDIVNEGEDNEQSLQRSIIVKEFTFNNQYVNGKIRRIAIDTTLNGYQQPVNEYATSLISNKKTEDTNYIGGAWILPGSTLVDVTAHQELYFIKLNTLGSVYDVKIGHNFELDIPNPQINTQYAVQGYNSAKMTYKNLIIENQEIEAYLNANNVETYIKSPTPNLNATYNNIQNTIAKYNTSEQKGTYNLVGTNQTFNNNEYTYDQEISVGNYKDKTTYYMQYIQPYLIDPNAMPNAEHVSYGVERQAGTITITGKYNTATITPEVIDVPGVMFDVLGMPFTFISTAFNLTLFAGTPYAINISTLFLSIIAVLVFVFLIKIIIGIFAGK